MKEYQSLSPTRWDCKYHVVFYTEATEEANFRGVTLAAWGDISRISGTQGIESCRRTEVSLCRPSPTELIQY